MVEARSLLAPIHEGTVVGEKYRIRRALARGGTALVYEAEHVQLGQRFAVKVLDDSAWPSSAGAWNRLLGEARAAAQLTSEHAVRVFDVGLTLGQQPFVVMEKLVGRDLARELQEDGPLPIARASALVLQACHALAEAHASGLVHRDVKPSNLFVTTRPDGSPHLTVLDFGLAHASSRASSEAAAHRVCGSPGYASPEQLGTHDTVDARADVWGLGVVLYEIVTGKRPFEANTLASSLLSAVLTPVPTMTSPHGSVPPAFEALVRRCLQTDREQRFTSVAELADALVEFAPASFAHYPNRIRERFAAAPSTRIRTPVARDSTPSSARMRAASASTGSGPPPTRRSADRPPPLLVAEVIQERLGAGWKVALVLALTVVAVALWLQRAGRQVPAPSGAPSVAASTPSSTASTRLLLAPLPSSNVTVPHKETGASTVVTVPPRQTPRTQSAPSSPPQVPKASALPDPMTYR